MDSPRVDDLSTALFSAISLVVRRLRQTAAPGEPSLPERSALARLDRNGPATAADLARAEQISPQAMGITLASLEERGLVERRRDEEDRRRSVTVVTEAGREALRLKRSARAAAIAAGLADGFTDEELRTLAAAAPLIQRLAEKI
ncbi:MarR family winged helix-turn-helix transcriptional regulator [Catenulispora rubra]|uniref:MarR family winged helix-turn-helix transcriptional regulator n=1 Tax=Catenulispora rubra TaxID=280293 RepID=UPI0018925400|nr:MarR family transcriptional regulator [Catenulispora rubra]